MYNLIFTLTTVNICIHVNLYYVVLSAHEKKKFVSANVCIVFIVSIMNTVVKLHCYCVKRNRMKGLLVNLSFCLDVWLQSLCMKNCLHFLSTRFYTKLMNFLDRDA